MPSVRLEEFDIWRPGYGFASVSVFIGGTTQLASIFLDQALTEPAPNPQTLLQQTFSGISYGKWPHPLYTGQPYQLQINSVDATGVVAPPITSLAGQDASEATVTVTGGAVANNLDDILARRISVLDYGPFLAVNAQGASAVTNTATLNTAIGVAGANGGGTVEIPAGTFQFVSLILPPGVIIIGAGQAATTLQSTQSGNVVTVSGALAGFRHLTLDGLSQVNGSIGLFAQSVNQIILDDVLVQRFATGIQLNGGSGHHWRDLHLSDCVTGYLGQGFTNTQNGGGGSALEFCTWDGGIVDTCLTAGITLQSVDLLCDHHTFENIQFNSNEGTAFNVVGARATVMRSCEWSGNTTDIALADGATLNSSGTNTVIGFDCQDGAFPGAGVTTPAAISLTGTLQNVAFRRCEWTNETITLTSPQNNVLAQDCRQVSGVTIAGQANAFISAFTYREGISTLITTNNTSTAAWSITLASGQRVYLEAKVVARAQNNADSAFLHFSVNGKCTGASLLVSNVTASFTAGKVLTGQTSGATARITVISGSTLTLQDISGTFINNEIVTDTAGGSGTANGTVTPGTASIGTNNVIFTTVHDDVNWLAAFAASGQTISLNVTGDTSMTVEWFVDVSVTPATMPIV
jgi:hypothetical protein